MVERRLRCREDEYGLCAGEPLTEVARVQPGADGLGPATDGRPATARRLPAPGRVASGNGAARLPSHMPELHGGGTDVGVANGLSRRAAGRAQGARPRRAPRAARRTVDALHARITSDQAAASAAGWRRRHVDVHQEARPALALRGITVDTTRANTVDVASTITAALPRRPRP